MATSASFFSLKITKPNPLFLLLLYPSIITFTPSISPNLSNKFLNSLSVVSYGRLPIYNLIPLTGEGDLFLLGDFEFLGDPDPLIGDLELLVGDFEFLGDLDPRLGDFEPLFGDFELLLVGDLDSRFGEAESLSTEDPLRTGEVESERRTDESLVFDSGLSI